MNETLPLTAARERDVRADFPGLFNADGSVWHYLDTAASAQKPQAVIDAMARALGRDYATVHRGVYSRSAEMTLGYEAARRRVARFMGGHENEIVFVRGATEAINLVAASWGAKRSSAVRARAVRPDLYAQVARGELDADHAADELLRSAL